MKQRDLLQFTAHAILLMGAVIACGAVISWLSTM